MKQPRQQFGMAALLTAALAGCAMQPHQASVPTSIKSGQSWVVTHQTLAEQILDTCSRDSPTRHPGNINGYWTPNRQQIDQLEARQTQLMPAIPAPRDFDRQYVGIMAGTRPLIYINAFRLAGGDALDPGKTAIRTCGGGNAFWGAVYDPQTGAFSDIAINSPH